jgi:hypothetical protein
MSGGTFLKRNSVQKADGEPLQLRDLAVGNVVSIYGQEFHITDADQSTRDYFRYVVASSHCNYFTVH